MNGLYNEYDNALRMHNNLIGAMRSRAERYQEEGFPERAAEIRQEMTEEIAEFEKRWAPVLTYYEEWQQRRRSGEAE